MLLPEMSLNEQKACYDQAPPSAPSPASSLTTVSPSWASVLEITFFLRLVGVAFFFVGLPASAPSA